MTDDGDRLTAELAAIKARAESATAGPWWFDEDDQVFRLHGVYTIIPPFIEGMPGQVVNHQILKAPKTGTPYAEYWPNEADAAFIVAARTDVPRLVKALEAALALAAEWVADADELDRDVASARKSRYKSDHEQADTDEAVARALRGHAEAVREVIASALTGTGTGGA